MNVITNDTDKCALALAALHHVDDPEIGLNVVDLGLIYRLYFDHEEKKVNCIMTLTTQFCPMGESITDGVKEALQGTFQDETIEVQLVFEPAWNFEMISEEGHTFLNH
jgi:metal-sulfur cluster biosynthetic enzyme